MATRTQFKDLPPDVKQVFLEQQDKIINHTMDLLCSCIEAGCLTHQTLEHGTNVCLEAVRKLYRETSPSRDDK